MRSASSVFGDVEESAGIASVASETYAGRSTLSAPEATAVGSLLLFAQSGSAQHRAPPRLAGAHERGRVQIRPLRLTGSEVGFASRAAGDRQLRAQRSVRRPPEASGCWSVLARSSRLAANFDFRS